jgi:hypothetical protein
LEFESKNQLASPNVSQNKFTPSLMNQENCKKSQVIDLDKDSLLRGLLENVLLETFPLP